nr:S1 RNA-binding domain-containing protein [Flavobacterium sp. ASV13]
MDKIVEKVLLYGLGPTFSLVLLFLIVQDPTRAYKLKSLIVSPFFHIFKWFKREYVASEVASTLNTFFSKELRGEAVHIKINWIKSDKDPFFQSGKLIVRMKRDEDQTMNILSATRYALPKIICPVFREHIDNSHANAIDFAFLQKLADQLGNHGKSVFKKHFLNPEIEFDPTLSLTLNKLRKLDRFGVFTTIFINELDHIGEGLYADSNTNDITPQLIKFIDYLCTIADRDAGQEIELMYFSDCFKVSIILLAKTHIASKKGLIPYLRRLNINLEKGSDSIYIIAFPQAHDFLSKFVKAVDGNQRVSINKTYSTKNYDFNFKSSINICCLRRNKLFTNESFIKRLELNDIKVGLLVHGKVIDCSIDEALISFQGIDGTIRKSECSWFSYINCNDILKVGDTKFFMIKNIDRSNGHISLSLKLDKEDPWEQIQVPKVGDVVTTNIIVSDAMGLKAKFNNQLEIFIPKNEISWYLLSDEERKNFENVIIDVLVVKSNKEEKTLEGSIRQLETDPWPAIHQSLLKGMTFNGKVCEVSDDYVGVKIDNGLVGRIPKNALLSAGYEYANYKENLIVGQGIDVVVTKVFLNKNYIRLDLQRNYDSN